MNLVEQKYDVIWNLAIKNGFSKENMSYTKDDNLIYLHIFCHKLLTLVIFWDREWTIEYHYPNGINHNHIFDEDLTFIEDLFAGNIFILINNRFFKLPDNEFNFVGIDQFDFVFNNKKNKNKILLFSVNEIFINN